MLKSLLVSGHYPDSLPFHNSCLKPSQSRLTPTTKTMLLPTSNLEKPHFNNHHLGYSFLTSFCNINLPKVSASELGEMA